MVPGCQIGIYLNLFWFSLQNNIWFTKKKKKVPYTYRVSKILAEQAKLAFLSNGGHLGC